jgi:carboxymethylenebutenolidase
VVLLLPEVFGVNGWVRSVADRLAAEGYAALALPIFARTAPDLELGYDAEGLAMGREHRDAVTAQAFLDDACRAIAFLQGQQPLACRGIGVVGFCIGGHLALLAATLPEVAATCAFYGARVSNFRPGGGEPTLAVVRQIAGDLLFIAGDQDPLIPPEELQAIDDAFVGDRQRLVVAQGAGHGFLCEARADYHPEAAAMGWRELLELFGKAL